MESPKFIYSISKSQQRRPAIDNGDRINRLNNSDTNILTDLQYLSAKYPITLSTHIRYNDFNFHPIIGEKLKWTISAYAFRFHPQSSNYLSRLDEFSFLEEGNLSSSSSSKRQFLDCSIYHSSIDNNGNSSIILSVNSIASHAIGTSSIHYAAT
jgi:hypothetical protein